MYRCIIAALGLMLSAYGHALIFPAITDVKITSCEGSSCDENVYYSGTSALIDIGPPAGRPPFGNRELKIVAWGVHCNFGSPATGFSICKWGSKNHSPVIRSDCQLASADSWELRRDATCSALTSWWGPHTGAGPGGECVMFGLNGGGNDTSYIDTPYGRIDATTAANSGNRFCIKPLPPGTVCEITLPSEINHGTLRAGISDTKVITGSVNCGEKPVIEVVGGTRVELAPGVVTNLDIMQQSDKDVRIQSDMAIASSARAGEYSAAVIVTASPY